MKKVVCDFCNKETDDEREITIPSIEPIEVRGGKNNLLLFTFGYTVKDAIKDVCPLCRQKIAYLLDNTDFTK